MNKNIDILKTIIAVLLLCIFPSGKINGKGIEKNPNTPTQNKLSAERPANTLRVLYWNIQNGMWSDQGNHYDNFVGWVKSYSPDVCIWCEAQTIYQTGTADPCKAEDRYLVKNWGELAARYGHSYWTISGHRDNYPQVITSKYPIEKTVETDGAEPDNIKSHVAGQYQIEFCGEKINFVSLHTWPHAYAYRAKDRAASKAEKGGDKYRRMEITYICSHTINASPHTDREYWFMCGDFNARSPKDNEVYKFETGDSRFFVHDYILQQTPYLDIIKERYPDQFISSTGGKSRIDFVYCTRPLLEKVIQAEILRDDYTGNIVRDPQKLSNFYHPSDHRPILVDFDMGKKK